jgi:type IV pilus assembly protein PilW
MMNKKQSIRATREDGLSLIELMIAMTLGLILIGGVIGIYLSSKSSYRLSEGLSQVQENGRFASRFIVNDVRMAGYMGCNAKPIAKQNVLKIAGGDPVTLYHFDFFHDSAVEGFDDINSTPGKLGVLAHEPIHGSDILTVRTTVGDGVHVTNPTPAKAYAVEVNSIKGFDAGDIAVISDCGSTGIFEVTDAFNEAGNAYLQYSPGSGPLPGNSAGETLARRQRGANVIRIATVNYFVAPRDATDDDCAKGTCSLWRTIGNTEEELVPGVENMQVKYGVDTDGNLVPDKYVSANDVADWNNVVSVRIALLVASSGSSVDRRPAAIPSYELLGETVHAPARDMKLRHVFVNTISIRNRSL